MLLIPEDIVNLTYPSDSMDTTIYRINVPANLLKVKEDSGNVSPIFKRDLKGDLSSGFDVYSHGVKPPLTASPTDPSDRSRENIEDVTYLTSGATNPAEGDSVCFEEGFANTQKETMNAGQYRKEGDTGEMSLQPVINDDTTVSLNTSSTVSGISRQDMESSFPLRNVSSFSSMRYSDSADASNVTDNNTSDVRTFERDLSANELWGSNGDTTDTTATNDPNLGFMATSAIKTMSDHFKIDALNNPLKTNLMTLKNAEWPKDVESVDIKHGRGSLDKLGLNDSSDVIAKDILASLHGPTSYFPETPRNISDDTTPPNPVTECRYVPHQYSPPSGMLLYFPEDHASPEISTESSESQTHYSHNSSTSGSTCVGKKEVSHYEVYSAREGINKRGKAAHSSDRFPCKNNVDRSDEYAFVKELCDRDMCDGVFSGIGSASREFSNLFDPSNYNDCYGGGASLSIDKSEMVTQVYFFLLQMKLLNTLDLVRAVCRPWGIPPHGNDYVYHFDQIVNSSTIVSLRHYESIFLPIYNRFSGGNPTLLWSRVDDVDYFKIVYKLECLRMKLPFDTSVYNKVLKQTLSHIDEGLEKVTANSDETSVFDEVPSFDNYNWQSSTHSYSLTSNNDLSTTNVISDDEFDITSAFNIQDDLESQDIIGPMNIENANGDAETSYGILDENILATIDDHDSDESNEFQEFKNINSDFEKIIIKVLYKDTHDNIRVATDRNEVGQFTSSRPVDSSFYFPLRERGTPADISSLKSREDFATERIRRHPVPSSISTSTSELKSEVGGGSNHWDDIYDYSDSRKRTKRRSGRRNTLPLSSRQFNALYSDDEVTRKRVKRQRAIPKKADTHSSRRTTGRSITYGIDSEGGTKVLNTHVVSASVSYDKRQQRFMAQWKTREGTKHSKSFYAKRYATPLMARKHAELYKMYILQHRSMNTLELPEPTYEQLAAQNFQPLDDVNISETFFDEFET